MSKGGMKINICHLYPDLLDLYGDRGNILTLAARCRWRGLEAAVERASLGDTLAFSSMDILFIGGGSDREQGLLVEDLMKRREELKAALADGLVVLAICGGYQLLGEYYQTSNEEKIPGLGILDAWTVAGDKRLIGNVAVELKHRNPGSRTDQGEKKKKPAALNTLVGFENHSGKTYLGKDLLPLGRTLAGHGNNGQDGTEGVRWHNIFGTYLHGPLLPKNPHLADLLLELACERRGYALPLPELDDRLEILAHRTILERLIGTK